MTVRHVNIGEVQAALAALPVDGHNPPGCRYTDESGRHCAVGQVLVVLGLPCPTGDDADEDGTGINTTVFNNPDVQAWLEARDVVFDPEAVALLFRVQQHLDINAGRPSWGAAVARAFNPPTPKPIR